VDLVGHAQRLHSKPAGAPGRGRAKARRSSPAEPEKNPALVTNSTAGRAHHRAVNTSPTPHASSRRAPAKGRS
jgi:hypothetical protein